MRILSSPPADALSPFVDSFIHYADNCPDHYIERLIPDGHAYLVVELDGMPELINVRRSFCYRRRKRGLSSACELMTHQARC